VLPQARRDAFSQQAVNVPGVPHISDVVGRRSGFPDAFDGGLLPGRRKKPLPVSSIEMRVRPSFPAESRCRYPQLK